MDKHERIARIESVDTDGVFRAILATEGEASDGDILSIAGGRIPARMPMLLSHWNDPTAVAGSITEPTKELKASPPTLRITGTIEMGGVGGLADVRRDVAFMMNKHGGAMSIRWDEVDGGKQPIRRINLPSDHAYFVDAETATGVKRWGYFWPEWRAVEGSIVALGADPAAKVDGRLYATRAEETDGEVSAFWRVLAEAAEQDDGAGKVAAALASIRADATALLEHGDTSVADLINALSDISAFANDSPYIQACRVGDHLIFLPDAVADQLQQERAEREVEPISIDPEPEPDLEPEPQADADQRSPLTMSAADISAPLDTNALQELLERLLNESTARTRQRIKSLVDMALGKVT